MRLLFDINVILDVVLAREPWVRESAALLSAVEKGRVEGAVAGHSATSVHYVVARARDRKAAATTVTDLLRNVAVVPLGDEDLQQALVLGLDDFEDAVQAAALRIGADFLVTRNAKDLECASVGVRAPGEILALL